MALDPRLSLLGRPADLSLQPFFEGGQAMRQAQAGLLALQEQQRQLAEAAQVRQAYAERYGQPASAPPGLAGVQPAPVQERPLGGSPTAAFQHATLPDLSQGQTPNQPSAGLLAQGTGLGGMGLAPPPQEAFIRRLYATSPQAGREAEAHAWQSQKLQLDNAFERTTYLAQVAQGILAGDSQQAYEVGKAMLAQAGMPTSEMPATYDRALVQQWYAVGQSSADRLAQAKIAHEQAQIARLRTQAPDYGLGDERNALMYELFGEQIPPGSPPTPAQTRRVEAEYATRQAAQERDKAWARKEAELGTEEELTASRERGKLAAGQPALQRQMTAQMGQLERQWQTTEEELDAALALLEQPWARQTGAWGAVIAPGTPAYDLRQKLETIRANVGFDRLQQMREASPTGGALGQVSDSENRLLQATAGSLDPKQSADQLRRNLQRIKADIRALRQDRREAFQRQFGTAAPGSGRAPAGTGGTGKAPGSPGGQSPYGHLPATQLTPEQRKEELEWLRTHR